jgi:hypothetical protein
MQRNNLCEGSNFRKRGSLSQDWIVKAFPVGKGVSEMMEEGGEEGGCSIFLFFSSAKVISLLCQGYKFLI